MNLIKQISELGWNTALSPLLILLPAWLFNGSLPAGTLELYIKYVLAISSLSFALAILCMILTLILQPAVYAAYVAQSQPDEAPANDEMANPSKP